ncbi:MAG TPA: energy-coupling factor transporter ATPase, partial [Clostridiales bacterium]|nr:energy-coupling factor transporter ATPase [Clostridiales bacterium]
GEFVCILGCNGSGKSTLVRHLNALLQLQHGELTIAGIDVSNENDIWRLRRICGMVFQNPD